MSRYPSGPKDSFLGFGNAIRIWKNPLGFILDLGSYGDISSCRLPLPPCRLYLVNHPDLVREVLITQAKTFCKLEKHTRVLKQFAGDGLLASEGELWKRQRRLVQPAFAARRMTHYAQVVVDHTRRMLDGWQSGALHNMPEEMRLLTLAIIAKALFDVELTGQAARLSEVSQILTQATLREVSSFFTLPDWLPLPGKRRKRWALQTLDILIRGIIRDRRASGQDKGDLLSMLLLAVDEEGDSQRMTDQQAHDEAKSLFNAGHETVSAALTWTWYAIARHPEVEARLIQEVQSTLGDRLPTIEDVPQLSYTGMVVKESLRLYPPVWGLTIRKAIRNVQLAEYEIPKGGWVFLCPYVTHRNPLFFENPGQFDPERFAPDRAHTIPPYAYFPFGAGPHVCIGNAFAMIEMTLVITTILQQFRVALAPGQGEVELEPDIIVRPKGGLTMKATRVRAALVGTDKHPEPSGPCRMPIKPLPT